MIIDPDAEQLIVDYLTEQLPLYGFTDIPVSDRVPAVGVESVTVIRTGGARRDLVTDQPQISIDVRAGYNSRAVAIINMVRTLLNDLWSRSLDGFMIYDVNELSGPYSNPVEPDFCRYSQNFMMAIRSKTAVFATPTKEPIV